MDELLTGERKEHFCDMIESILADDILTNMDAMMIIEIIKNACERKKTVLYEDAMKTMISGEDGEV